MGGDASSVSSVCPNALRLQTRGWGRANLLVRMHEDSHFFRRTHVLPSAASRPEAVYDPEAVFAAS